MRVRGDSTCDTKMNGQMGKHVADNIYTRRLSARLKDLLRRQSDENRMKMPWLIITCGSEFVNNAN